VRGREMESPLPRMTGEVQQMQKRKLLLASNPSQQIKGPLQREHGLTGRRKQRKRGWRQTPPLINKERTQGYRHKSQTYTHKHIK
jgi:hypothetical protein